MSELMQAAERLREDAYDFGGDFEQAHIARSNDECVVVCEYLRLTDPTPIDEAWLLSVGFKYRHPHPISREKSLELDELEVWAFKPSGDWEWGARLGTKLLREIDTRGHVRMLCAALAIELKE